MEKHSLPQSYQWRFRWQAMEYIENGGMSEVIPLPEGGFAAIPPMEKLAYNRVMREFRNWKYYRGGMADDIWIYDPAAKK